MIVLDASAAVLALLNDGEARRALGTRTVVVPHLADSEITHALRAQVLRGRLQQGQAHAALASWARLGVRRFGAVGLLDRIWELRDNLTAYDATYIAPGRSARMPARQRRRPARPSARTDMLHHRRAPMTAVR